VERRRGRLHGALAARRRARPRLAPDPPRDPAEHGLDPLGTAASHGCIRIDDDVVARIVSAARPGTPVTIHG